MGKGFRYGGGQCDRLYGAAFSDRTDPQKCDHTVLS